MDKTAMAIALTAVLALISISSVKAETTFSDQDDILLADSNTTVVNNAGGDGGVVVNSKSSNSITSQVSNLLAMGNKKAAEDLMKQWPNLFPNQKLKTNRIILTIQTTLTKSRDLKLGSVGKEVKLLQQFLNAKGFLLTKSGAGSPGKETTFFGSLTKFAVIKFQEKFASEILTPLGLKKGTGIVGKYTRAKINELEEKIGGLGEN